MTVLANRFELVDATSTAEGLEQFEAIDRETGERCIIRELVVGRVADWKQVELFEREAQTLSRLEHPAIPEFITYFQGYDDSPPTFYLVHSPVDGEALADRVKRAGPLETHDLKRIVDELLSILEYLHRFSPPVVHRDINPANVVIRDDGSIVLKGFGSVQVRTPGTLGGSTIVGATGYLAPEQLMGKATPSSDLYGVGACLVFAMTAQSPADLPLRSMRPDWKAQSVTTYPLALTRLVHALLEPDPDVRPQTSAEARRIFASEQGTEVARRPTATQTSIERTSRKLVVRFAGTKADSNLTDALKYAGLIAFMTFAPFLEGGIGRPDIGVFVAPIAALVVFLGMYLGSGIQANDTTLALDADGRFRVTEDGKEKLSGRVEDIIGVQQVQQQLLVLETRAGTSVLSADIRRDERDWVAGEVEGFMEAHGLRT